MAKWPGQAGKMVLRIGRDLLPPQALPHRRPDAALTCAEVREWLVQRSGCVIADIMTGFLRLAGMADDGAGHVSANGQRNTGEDTSQKRRDIRWQSDVAMDTMTGSSWATACKELLDVAVHANLIDQGRNGAALPLSNTMIFAIRKRDAALCVAS